MLLSFQRGRIWVRQSKETIVYQIPLDILDEFLKTFWKKSRSYLEGFYLRHNFLSLKKTFFIRDNFGVFYLQTFAWFWKWTFGIYVRPINSGQTLGLLINRKSKQYLYFHLSFPSNNGQINYLTKGDLRREDFTHF